MNLRLPPALMLLTGAALAQAAPGEWDRELPAQVRLVDDPQGPRTHAVIRVLDDATDRPIRGARISCHEEAAHPMAGGAPPLQEVATDADGEALIDLARAGSWTFYEAPGCGPRAVFGLSEVQRLSRGEDIRLEVRDWLERPLPGARIEAILGCGHVPEVRAAVSDAAGRLLLPCLSLEETRLWVRAPEMRGRNETYSGDLRDLEVVDGLRILHCDPAPAVEGRILDADSGAPLAGVAVGTTEAHRGPWTRTDAQGRFALFGADAGEGLQVETRDCPVGSKESVPSAWFRVAPGVPRVVRIRDPRGEDPEVIEEGAEKPLRVKVTAGEGFEPEGLDLLFVRDGDGCVRDGSLDAEGNWEGTLPEGTWTVTAGTPAGRWRRESARVVAGKDAEASLLLRENPVRMVPHLPVFGTPLPRSLPELDFGDLTVLVGEGRFRATRRCREILDYFLPSEGPFGLEVEFTSGVRQTLRWGFDGVWPEGSSPGMAFRRSVDSETEGTSEPPDSSVQVLLSDGKPAARAQWTVETDPGRHRHSFWNGRLDAEGKGTHPLDGHQRLVFTVDEDDFLVPLRVLSEGPGDRTLRWPCGAVEVQVLDADGRSVPGAVVRRGEDSWKVPADGLLPLHGLPGGAVRLWICAPGMRAHDLRLLLPEGGRRAVEVRLRP